jgi:hypothetical protein
LSTRPSSTSFQLTATTDGLHYGDRGCSRGQFVGVGPRTNAWRQRGAAAGVMGVMAR